jgi:hypothetical protein
MLASTPAIVPSNGIIECKLVSERDHHTHPKDTCRRESMVGSGSVLDWLMVCGCKRLAAPCSSVSACKFTMVS